MDKNNTTKRTQPQPGTPATDVVEGGLSTAMAAERPIALVTKEPVPTVDKIDEIDEIDETNETNESSLKRVRKEGEPSSGRTLCLLNEAGNGEGVTIDKVPPKGKD